MNMITSYFSQQLTVLSGLAYVDHAVIFVCSEICIGQI